MAYAQGEHRQDDVRLIVSACVVIAFVCAAFACVASTVVSFLYFSGSLDEAPVFGLKIFTKAIVFAALSAVLLRTIRYVAPKTNPPLVPPRPPDLSRWGFLPAAAIAALLFLPNLGRHPWPSPDELHHLIVARNFAEHGAYASGLAPDFVYFDHYDSVGAPVIGLVAASLKTFGVGLIPGRVILAAFGITLTPLTYFLLLPLFGTRASAVAAMLALAAFGTVYLSRSVYGEVPAMDFVLGGLLLWRRGIEPRRAKGALILAGVCFGLAILTKTFMAVAVLAVGAAYLFDRATHRRISPAGIVLPALGTMAVLACWQAVFISQRHLVALQPSIALYYRHSLSFGVGPIWEHLATVAGALPLILLAFVALYAAVPKLFRDPYDPAFMVLFLIAPLIAFWYAFFTPMHLPRYLWYPGVIAAMFCGSLVVSAFGPGTLRRFRVAPRWAIRGALAAAMAWAYVVPTSESAYKVFSADQAGPDQAVARYVAGLPLDSKLATTYWPAERLVNFLLERPVAVFEPGTALASDYDVLIESDRVGLSTVGAGATQERFGHYVVSRRGSAAADHLASAGGTP